MERAGTDLSARLTHTRALMYAGRGEEAADELESMLAALDPADVESAMIVEATLVGSTLLDPRVVARVAGRARHAPADPTRIETPGERSWAAGRAVTGIVRGLPLPIIRSSALAAAADGTLAEALGADAPALNIALGTLWWIDEHAQVLTIAERTLELARREGPERALALAGTMRAAALQRLGDLEPAIAGARAALVHLHGDDELELVSWLASGVLAEALIDAGELDAAAVAFERQRDRRGGRSMFADAFRHAEGRYAMARGNAEAALACFDDCGARMRGWGVLATPLAAWRIGKARALLALGRRDEALEIAAEELHVAAAGSDRARGIALACLGEVTGGAAGVARLRDGIAALEAAGARVEHARALLALGVLLARQGEQREGRGALRTAGSLAQAGGAHAIAARAAHELRVAGARPATAPAGQLTPTERRVADLAAAGHGNREIATALGITIRTVETHLTRVYAKLDIAGRAQL